MTASTHYDRPVPAARHTRAGGHVCLPLREVIARIDTADAHGAATVRLEAADRPEPVDLPLHGTAGRDLRRLLASASTRHFDTVRVTHGPVGPVVGVCRRRLRTRG